MFTQYFRRLFQQWFGIVFYILDVIAVLIDLFVDDLSIPIAVYIVVFFTGYIIANVQLFFEQEKQIISYKAYEANIRIELKSAHLTYSGNSQFSSLLNIKIENNGLRENGLPGWVDFTLRVIFRNEGHEAGELEWETDYAKSRFPHPIIARDDFHGTLSSFTGMRHNIEGRVFGREGYWLEHFTLAEHDPESFAKLLSSLRNSKFKMVIRYRTKHAGGYSDWNKLEIEGDCEDFVNSVVKLWQDWGFSELAEIASPQ